MIKYPDYNNSIVQLTNSILRYFGADTHHNTLKAADGFLNHNYKNVILLILDGMGMNILNQLSADSFMRKNLVTEISSVYPSTTTAALTSILSGYNPMEHGWLGWSCYFKEVDKCVDLFTNADSTKSENQIVSTNNLAFRHMGYASISRKIELVSTYSVSPFSEHYANTFDDICTHLKNLSRTEGRKFIYAYHYQPDTEMHDSGCYTNKIKEMMFHYDIKLSELTKELKDTLLIISADHGMTDISMKCVEDYPHIQECLRKPITIEPRCCSMYVKEKYENVFRERFVNTFGDDFMLLKHDEFINAKVLGEGLKHSKIEDFVGDYVALGISDMGLWYKKDSGEWKDYKAAHAGLLEEEMSVPLIAMQIN